MKIHKRKARSDKGIIRLTERDPKFLRWVADGDAISLDLVSILMVRLDFMEWEDDYIINLDTQGLLLPEIIDESVEPLPAQARIYKVSERRAYKYMERLSQAGYVERGEPIKEGLSPWWVVTRKGIDVAGRSYSANKISGTLYNHVWVCNFLRLWYDLLFARNDVSTYKIKTGRVHLSEGGLPAVPDFSLWYQDTYDTINAELTEKRPAEERYPPIIRAYRLLGAKRHQYFCPDSRLGIISRWFEGEDQYRFHSLEHLGSGETRMLEDGTKYPPKSLSR